MSKLPQELNRLAPNVILYDYICPSKLFPRADVDWIESVGDYLGGEELRRIRDIEFFTYNTLTDTVNREDIPGLRPRAGIGCIYVARFSAGAFPHMIGKLLDAVPDWFPEEERYKFHVPAYRVTIPDGRAFYPIVFHGQLDQWSQRLQASAAVYRTALGQFDRGTFVVSEGERWQFRDLEVDVLNTRKIPKAW